MKNNEKDVFKDYIKNLEKKEKLQFKFAYQTENGFIYNAIMNDDGELSNFFISKIQLETWHKNNLNKNEK